MKQRPFLTNATSNSHRLTCVLTMVLAGVLLLYSASIVEALSGYATGSWGSTSDTQGFNMGPVSDRTCFLSGIAGNLNLGAQPGFGCAARGEPSMALLTVSEFEPKHYRLVAHGAACENQADQKVWNNNPVNAQATCFLTTAGKTVGHWSGNQDPKPVKLAPLLSAIAKRQCFLTGVMGVSGSWNNNNRFARVFPITTPSKKYPTTGWYLEANLPRAADGSYAYVTAACVVFPVTSTINSGVAIANQMTVTYPLTWGSGKKACALTGIQGAFKTNAWHDGIIMNPPAKIDGNWSLTVTAGKTAFWTCVK